MFETTPGSSGHQAAFELVQREKKMQPIIVQAKAFIRDEDGITALEYGILAGLISVLLIASITSISSSLQNIFSDIASEL
ncbi:Flp family type IVb pilin [Paraburkholderia unamae]|nr:Flp family type IVb pilin [Paraburkholderia unamae]